MTTVDRDIRQDVADVLVRYATAIDLRDWELFRSCFTDDCSADYGPTGVWTSADEITEWARRTHDQLGPTMHRITNQVVSPSAGGVTARSYYDVIVMDGGTLVTHAAGYYDDDLIATDDGWKISRRRTTRIFTDKR
jgi:3-phenylpropionate/cinnamic acid dioxygenase small subunit